MKKTLLLSAFVVISAVPALAQGSGQYAGVSQCWNGREFVTVKGNCPTANRTSGSVGEAGGSSSSSNSAAYGAINQAGYQLGYAFGQWLMGGGRNPQAELQKRLMMEELARRQAQAAALHREEEARRLAAMYNRLNATLKLSGLPDLKLKDVANGPVLHLKLGDANGQAGIKGLPGIYLNDDKTPYGIPGLPGTYTGGSGHGSELTNSKLSLKTGVSGVPQTSLPAANPVSPSAAPDPAWNSGAADEPKLALKLGASGADPATPTTPLAQAAPFDPSKMTPQQLADAAEMFSKLPAEEQQRLLAAAQNAGSAQLQSSIVGPAAAQALQPLQPQSAASQAAAGAPALEDASGKARMGFDTPLGRSAIQPAPISTSGTPATENAGLAQTQVPSGKRDVIKSIDTLAEKLGWSREKQTRLDTALNKLDFDGDGDVTEAEIRRTWQDVIAREHDPELVRESAEGRGLGLPGAGTQTVHHDCVVFALANAAGLPYGVVATRATELIRLGDWREARERANPQATIERVGLTGGEVILLAESFGQAEVVSSSDFVKTLAEGRPILVNVVPPDANLHSGHEVVLTGTLRHSGETWFVMMDSNQGPQRRLFLSSKELNTILQENGVAFRPESGLTPKLLRESGGQ